MFDFNSPFSLFEVINFILLSFSYLLDPVNIIFVFSLIYSYNLIKIYFYKGIAVPLMWYKGLLISLIVVSFIVKYGCGIDFM